MALLSWMMAVVCERGNQHQHGINSLGQLTAASNTCDGLSAMSPRNISRAQYEQRASPLLKASSDAKHVNVACVKLIL